MDWIYPIVRGKPVQPEPLANTFAFYLHERAWRRMDGHAATRNNAGGMCCGVSSTW